MNRRLPPDAFAHYLGLGLGRSYQAVADHFGTSKQAVTALAGKEDWPGRLRDAERRVGEAAARKAEDSIEQMNERHLRSLKVIQAKALECLRSLDLDTAMDAVRALDLAIKQERVVRELPGDRTAIDVGETIRREHERWLASVDDAGDPDEDGDAPMATDLPLDGGPPEPADPLPAQDTAVDADADEDADGDDDA